MKKIPAATPEEMGIPSRAISRVIKRLERDHVPMHSLLIARHGKMVFEGYYAPYTRETLHRMFSVTKSFVSLAIGCLEKEGRISLDDPICRYFPEYVPNEVHPWIAAMTIRHMLEMKSCYSGTTYKKDSTTENWVESFFNSNPTHPSGTIFMYDTSATHVLGALVEKLTGKKLLDYMREQFLDEIGFSRDAYVLPDPFGVPMGGSGLMALPSDLMRLGLLLMNHGADPELYGKTEDGKDGAESASPRQIYPRSYLDEAVAFQGASAANAPIKEESYGYGRQFWRFSHNGFGAYGMGGQLLLCYPDEDLICVTTADTQDMKGGNQFIYNAFYEELFPLLSDTPLPEDREALDHLTARRKALSVPILSGSLSSPKETQIHQKTWHLDKNPGGFTKLGIEFDFSETGQNAFENGGASSGELILSSDNQTCHIPFGFGRTVSGIFEPYHQKCTASACWLTIHTLYIRIWLVDECTSSVHFLLDFSGSHVTALVRKTEETAFTEFQGFWNGECPELKR